MNEPEKKCPACSIGILEGERLLCERCNEYMHRADMIEDRMRAAQPIVLLSNNCTFRHGCAICRESCKDSETPAWLATCLGDLCHRCAKARAPELLKTAKDLAMLHWQCDDEEEAEKLLRRAMRYVPHVSKVDWSNPPADQLKNITAILGTASAFIERKRAEIKQHEETRRRDLAEGRADFDDLPF